MNNKSNKELHNMYHSLMKQVFNAKNADIKHALEIQADGIFDELLNRGYFSNIDAAELRKVD